ncbi:hypothetical protein WG66_008937 [Moniliophthora roreri]|nr:hypothetical protein WG66_008937 [Moniliophthora roreri]
MTQLSSKRKGHGEDPSIVCLLSVRDELDSSRYHHYLWLSVGSQCTGKGRKGIIRPAHSGSYFELGFGIDGPVLRENSCAENWTHGNQWDLNRRSDYLEKRAPRTNDSRQDPQKTTAEENLNHFSSGAEDPKPRIRPTTLYVRYTTMLPKSFSQSQTTLTTVEGYPLKRRRLEGFKSETNLASQSRTFQLSPTPTLAPSCSHSHIPPATIELRQLVIPPRPDSPVPTEPDADHADRADVERDLERRWGIKVKDYARLPAITAQNSKGKEKERTRVWEAFFAKDAMGQYEWFMSRGSKEWLVLKWEGTEVLEESQEQEEKTEEDVEHPKTPPLAEQALPQQGQQQASPQASPGRSPRPLVRTTYNPLALAGRKPPSTSPRREVQLGHEAQQSSPKRGLTRQDTEVAVASSSKPPSTTNPGRALVRHTRNPMTMVSTNATPNTSSFSTPPNSTASSSSDPEKTPLLPSPSFSLFQRKRDIRKYGIPGKFLYRLRELGWVTEEEARRRWLGCDWDEYNHYIDEETKRGNKRGDGEIEKEVGFMGKGTVGYPYFVIWGSVGTGALGVGSRKDKGKEKEKAQVPVPESELGQEAEESQNVHATLSGTIEDQDREKTPPLHEDQEKTPPIHGSIDSGYVETEPDDMDVEEEQSQNVHATLSGSLSPPAGSPPPPAAASSSSSSQQQRDQETTSSPPKQKRPNPLAPLYFHAIAEDSSLAFGRPPSKEYRQLLGERAGDVWNWLNEWSWQTRDIG